MDVFHEKTIAALEEHSNVDEDVQGTVEFLQLILDFWKIVNVKGPYDDIKLRDPLREGIRSPHDENLELLEKIAVVVENMEKKSKGKRQKELTKDTASAFACRGLIELSKYLLENKGFEYVLLGKFTSDHIEKEFGKLRQGSGGVLLYYCSTDYGKSQKRNYSLVQMLFNSLKLTIIVVSVDFG